MFLEKLTETTTPEIIATGIALCAFLVQMFYYLYYYANIVYQNKKLYDGNVPHRINQPPVSVIICSKNEADHLEKLLPTVLEQKYPKFQVIVVNDGSTDESTDILDKYSKKYPHLYTTFLPMDAKYISRKKMCITVGVKAAQYDHLLFLDADCMPETDQWISDMVRNFVDKTEVVLGYSSFKNSNGFLGKLINFDNIFSTMQSIGFALRGKAFLGTHRNIAYTKDTFLKNKGFVKNLKNMSGEDDLFIQQISTKENTKVEIAAKTISLRDYTFKSFRYDVERKIYMMPAYKGIIKTLLCLDSLTRYLFMAAAITAAVMFFQSEGREILAVIPLSLMLIRYITQATIFSKTSKILGEDRILFSFAIFELILPLFFLYLQTIGKIGNKQQSMWHG